MRLLKFLLLIVLGSCGNSNGSKIMKYEIKTTESAILQQILINGNDVSYYIFLPHKNRAIEGKISIESDSTLKIKQLMDKIESTNCKNEAFADDQIIEIELNSKKILCTESALHRHPQVSQIVSEFRNLTRQILERVEK